MLILVRFAPNISKMGKTSILVWVLWASAGGASRLPRSTTLQSTQTRATRGRATLILIVSSSSRGTCAWGPLGDVGQRVKKIHRVRINKGNIAWRRQFRQG